MSKLSREELAALRDAVDTAQVHVERLANRRGNAVQAAYKSHKQTLETALAALAKLGA